MFLRFGNVCAAAVQPSSSGDAGSLGFVVGFALDLRCQTAPLTLRKVVKVHSSGLPRNSLWAGN